MERKPGVVHLPKIATPSSWNLLPHLELTARQSAAGLGEMREVTVSEWCIEFLEEDFLDYIPSFLISSGVRTFLITSIFTRGILN